MKKYNMGRGTFNPMLSAEVWTAAEEFFIPMLEEAESALNKIGCNETYHRLGGIDDCVRCKALVKIKEMKGE